MTTYMNKSKTLIEDVENDSDSSIEIMDDEFNANDSDSQNNQSDDGNKPSGSDDDQSEDNENENAGWADSLAKILKSNKPKGKRSLVLSKAKKLSDIKKAKTVKEDFEVIGNGEIKEEKPSVEDMKLILPGEDDVDIKPKIKQENHPNFRVKPTILQREREKVLSKIATRGVVQLFNAVRNQQKDIERKIDDCGKIERKKNKVMKSVDKTQFLDKLMGQSKSQIVNQTESVKKEPKVKKEEPSTWNVFRDDFMLGAKMKDWDKQENKKGDNQESSMGESDSD